QDQIAKMAYSLVERRRGAVLRNDAAHHAKLGGYPGPDYEHGPDSGQHAGSHENGVYGAVQAISIGCRAGVLLGWKRFTRQCRLLNKQIGGTEHQPVSGHQAAGRQADDITWHEILDADLPVSAVASH